MEAKWYYSENGESIGPFSHEEIAERIKEAKEKPHFVRASGMPDWVDAKTLEEFGSDLPKPSAAPSKDQHDANTEAILAARALTKRHGRGHAGVLALRDVSFVVLPGELVAIMGPSGSGKSTLMNLIGLLDRPTSGTLFLAGHNTSKLSHDRLAVLRNREIGFVFQAYNLLARNTVLENVELPLIYSGVSSDIRCLKARAALEAVGLSHRERHWPSQMSGGEQQRAAIARALVTGPSLILADEPTGALDSQTGEAILALFQRLNREGRTIILVTHDEHVARHASRLIRIQDGVIQSDTAVDHPLRAETTTCAGLLADSPERGTEDPSPQ